MPAAICSSFDNAEIDCNLLLCGHIAHRIEIAVLDADCLAGVMRVEFFLQAGVKPGAFGAFYPERIAGNQCFAKGNQLAAVSRRLPNPDDNFGEAGVALQPDWRNLRQSDY